MFYQAVKEVSDEAEVDVEISVYSYWTSFLRPLIKGGYHAPILIINDELVCQGYDVPDKEMLKSKFNQTTK